MLRPVLRARHAWLPLLGVVGLLCGNGLLRASDTASVETRPHRCAPTRVTVTSATTEEVADICASVHDTFEFFASLDVATDADIAIEVSSDLQAICGVETVGCYLLAERRILLSSRAALASRKRLLGLPIDTALYRTLAVHEIVHAVVAQHMAPASPSTLAMEYLSAVVSIAIMDPQRRRQLLDSEPVEGFANESEIGLVYYLLNPARFSVKAFRHFVRPDAGAAFVRSVLAGDALIEDSPHTR